MAYASKEQSKRIRQELKAEFPEFKISVTVEHSSTIMVCIMAAPIKFTEKPYEQLNHFYLERYENGEILKRIAEIANKGNYDKSDIMTDYFEVGFYFRLQVGKWDKHFELINK
jgi:hypothetical protein